MSMMNVVMTVIDVVTEMMLNDLMSTGAATAARGTATPAPRQAVLWDAIRPYVSATP